MGTSGGERPSAHGPGGGRPGDEGGLRPCATNAAKPLLCRTLRSHGVDLRLLPSVIACLTGVKTAHWTQPDPSTLGARPWTTSDHSRRVQVSKESQKRLYKSCRDPATITASLMIGRQRKAGMQISRSSQHIPDYLRAMSRQKPSRNSSDQDHASPTGTGRAAHYQHFRATLITISITGLSSRRRRVHPHKLLK